jgi:hypothetical protein
VVIPSWRWIARISLRRTIRIFASSADSGSSRSSTCGSIASAGRGRPLLLPPGHLPREAVGAALEVDQLEQLPDALGDLGLRAACAP